MIYLTYNQKKQREYRFKDVLSQLHGKGKIDGIRLNLCQFHASQILVKLEEYLEDYVEYQEEFRLLVDLPYPYNKTRILHTTIPNREIIKDREYKIFYDSRLTDSLEEDGIYIQKPSVIHDKELIYYADGETGFRVIDRREGYVRVKALSDFQLSTNKSLSFGLVEEDDEIIKAVIKRMEDNKIKYDLMLSLVTSPEQIDKLAEICHPEVQIFAKIETDEACKRYKTLVDKSNGVVLARGDMAVLYSVEDVYWKCKEIIEYCKLTKKKVLLATDLLISLEERVIPNRADICDISCFVDQGCTDFILRNHMESVSEKVDVIQRIRKCRERCNCHI